MSKSMHTDVETWRVIPSLPRRLASSWGRIMTTPYLTAASNGGTRMYGGLPTVGAWDGNRYIISIDGHSHKVARLICEAFHGPAPEDKPICMHLDENSRNNRPDNLAWGTQKQNLNAPGFLAYCRQRTGENSPTRKAKSRHTPEHRPCPPPPDYPASSTPTSSSSPPSPSPGS